MMWKKKNLKWLNRCASNYTLPAGKQANEETAFKVNAILAYFINGLMLSIIITVSKLKTG